MRNDLRIVSGACRSGAGGTRATQTGSSPEWASRGERIKRRYKSAIHNVQRPFLDIERGFSDGFA